MAAISVVQGRGRVAAGLFVNPEDEKSFSGKEASQEAPDVERASRAWRNDLENIPIFLILDGIYVSAGLSTTAFVVYCLIFMVMRIAHTVCYLNSIQPFRTVSFTIGAITMLVMMVHMLIKVAFA